MKATSASLIHGINRNLPHLGVLLGVISKAEICFIFLECFNECFGTHHNKPLNHEQLVVVLNQGIQDLAIVWWICQFVPAYKNHQDLMKNPTFSFFVFLLEITWKTFIWGLNCEFTGRIYLTLMSKTNLQWKMHDIRLLAHKHKLKGFILERRIAIILLGPMELSHNNTQMIWFMFARDTCS